MVGIVNIKLQYTQVKPDLDKSVFRRMVVLTLEIKILLFFLILVNTINELGLLVPIYILGK